MSTAETKNLVLPGLATIKLDDKEFKVRYGKVGSEYLAVVSYNTGTQESTTPLVGASAIHAIDNVKQFLQYIARWMTSLSPVEPISTP